MHKLRLTPIREDATIPDSNYVIQQTQGKWVDRDKLIFQSVKDTFSQSFVTQLWRDGYLIIKEGK